MIEDIRSTFSTIESKIIESGYESLTPFEKASIFVYMEEKYGIQEHKATHENVLETVKKIKNLYFKKTCETEIEKGFTATNGHFYRTNRDDQTNMLGQFNVVLADPLTETVMWKTEDAGYISHSKEEWLDIYDQAFVHKQTQLFKYDSLKQQVNDATSHEEITAITWDEPEVITTTTEPETTTTTTQG